MERLKIYYPITVMFERMAKLSLPDLRETEDDWELFKGEIKKICLNLGEVCVDDADSISLEGYLFENQTASFTIKHSQEGARYISPIDYWGEFTKLEIGGIDWLKDKSINPRQARIFTMIKWQRLCPPLEDVFQSSMTPLATRDSNTIYDWLTKSSFSYTESDLFWNSVLIKKLREEGAAIPDATQPRISTPLPIFLESLWTLMHELEHLMVDDEAKTTSWLKFYAIDLELAKQNASLAERGEARKNFKRVEELEIDESTFRRFCSYLERWQIPDYRERLEKLREAWQANFVLK